MNPPFTILTALLLTPLASLPAVLPTNEGGAIAYLTGKGVEITKSPDGKATRLMVKEGGKLAAADFALIGKLMSLEQMGINGAPLGDGDWAFLKTLPKLKTLSIWQGHGFATLEPFSGLPVESLTIGGCMGLRDKNKGDAGKLRNAITTLHDLPNLTKGNWYHSPLAPDDTHLAHIRCAVPETHGPPPRLRRTRWIANEHHARRTRRVAKTSAHRARPRKRAELHRRAFLPVPAHA